MYLLVHMNTGEILLRHPLNAGPTVQEQPEKRVVLVAPKLKRKPAGTA